MLKGMNIQELNKRHFFQTDFIYRKGFGLSSRLLKFQNGIIYLEIIFGRRWKKNYNATAYEIARCWRDHHPELRGAVGCKIYIIDARMYPFKKELYSKQRPVCYDAKKGVIFSDNYMN